METTTMQMTIPTGMRQFVTSRSKEKSEMQNAMLLYPYIADYTISYGRAAEILGITKTRLISTFAKLGIPYINLSEEEIDEEIEMYDRIISKSK
ncbi:MAG: UPF0175 family protein [Bacteroidales bacterium]|nr:UPF0175 family protein [Bacteroidales bacterium]